MLNAALTSNLIEGDNGISYPPPMAKVNSDELVLALIPPKY
jgi:hypothetical protein